MASELNFTLDGVDGELKIVQSALSFKFYQNGVKLKKRGSFQAKFTVNTSDGNTGEVKVLNNALKGYMVEYKGIRTKLERGLTAVEKLLVFLPLIIFVTACITIAFISGIIGGALLGFCAAISVLLTANFIRKTKSIGAQLLFAIAVGGGAYLIYILIGIIYNRLTQPLFL
jgi:hypothetical protein